MQPKMEVESRKRPHTGEEDRIQTKKRVLTTTNGSPHVNGTEPEERMQMDNLEVKKGLVNLSFALNDTFLPQLFRKEAIFRRMRHYSRENERSQGRVAELESRILTYEAGLAALSACWTQVIFIVILNAYSP
jgi:E3 ubiquitin-protein ligase BRE1